MNGNIGEPRVYFAEFSRALERVEVTTHESGAGAPAGLAAAAPPQAV